MRRLAASMPGTVVAPVTTPARRVSTHSSSRSPGRMVGHPSGAQYTPSAGSLAELSSLNSTGLPQVSPGSVAFVTHTVAPAIGVGGGLGGIASFETNGSTSPENDCSTTMNWRG